MFEEEENHIIRRDPPRHLAIFVYLYQSSTHPTLEVLIEHHKLQATQTMLYAKLMLDV